jgi:hypothetical protein
MVHFIIVRLLLTKKYISLELRYILHFHGIQHLEIIR